MLRRASLAELRGGRRRLSGVQAAVPAHDWRREDDRRSVSQTLCQTNGAIGRYQGLVAVLL